MGEGDVHLGTEETQGSVVRVGSRRMVEENDGS